MCQVLRTSGWNLTDSDRGEKSGPVIVIVSGYFSPLHCGHLDYLEEAATAGDRLVVIVNNNEQQILKKGKLIMDQEDRLRIVKALSVVDEAIISIDNDRSVGRTLALIAKSNENSDLIFGNEVTGIPWRIFLKGMSATSTVLKLFLISAGLISGTPALGSIKN